MHQVSDPSVSTCDRSESLYLQLANDICEKVAKGILNPGTRLPSERHLAQSLNVSRGTVVTAYQELEARGVIRRQAGRGTYICAPPSPCGLFSWSGRLSERKVPRRFARDRNISFASVRPSIEFLQTERFREVAQAILQGSLCQFAQPAHSGGFAPLRTTMAERYGCHPDNVLITAGGSPALRLVAQGLTQRGDSIIVNSPCSPGALTLFAELGLRIVPWSFTASARQLEDLVISRRPKLLYVMPTFHNPTGRTMPIEKRLELLEVAARYRLPVVEHDTSSALYFTAPPPPHLRDLDKNGVVIHIAGTTKTLGDGCRLAFIVAPESAIEKLAADQEESEILPDTLTQLIVHEAIRRGMFDAHVKTLRHTHAARHALALEALRKWGRGSLRVCVTGGGLTLWCSLPRPLSTERLLDEANERSVSFVPGQLFYVDASESRELRVCFTAVAPEKIDEGIRMMVEAIEAAGESETVAAQTLASVPLPVALAALA